MMTNALFRRTLRASIIGTVIFFVVLFSPAGTLRYWQGWMFFLTFGVCSVLTTIYMARHDPKLLESRMRIGPKAETTRVQKIITTLGGPLFLAAYTVMVLDHRFRWSPAVPPWLSVVANAFGALGFLIYFLVVRENRFAAATVQVAESQTVISTGPYALVRHPMYSGAVLMLTWTPLALDSWWGLLFAPVFAGMLAWRLVDEERLLRRELAGYEAYTQKVRWRLVPGVW